eukprot:1366355-Pyramimonas_sp.AAC.1
MLNPRPCSVRRGERGKGVLQHFKSSRAVEIVVDRIPEHRHTTEPAAHSSISKSSRGRPRVTHTLDQGGGSERAHLLR